MSKISKPESFLWAIIMAFVLGAIVYGAVVLE